MRKLNTPGMDVTCFEYKGIQQHFIILQPTHNDDNITMLGKADKYIRDNNIQILSQFVFGGSEMQKNDIPEIDDYLDTHNWPITFIHGDVKSNGLLYGTQLHAISKCPLSPIYLNERLVGSIFEDKDAVYCFLGDIQPDNTNLTRTDQTRQVFDNIKKALATVEMDFKNVVRTWLYLDNLLDWYDEFNVVRTTFFNEEYIFNNLVPASTGIGAGNLQGAALAINVLAIKPKHNGVHIISVPSPMQCQANAYRSSFSRAVEVQFPDYRQLYISGTASIDQEGNSMYVGDVSRQIERTMKVVGAIIDSRSMKWQDTVRAIAYFKDLKDINIFYDYCIQHNLPHLPLSITQSDICRHDLLFEIEVDLMSQGESPVQKDIL